MDSEKKVVEVKRLCANITTTLSELKNEDEAVFYTLLFCHLTHSSARGKLLESILAHSLSDPSRFTKALQSMKIQLPSFQIHSKVGVETVSTDKYLDALKNVQNEVKILLPESDPNGPGPDVTLLVPGNSKMKPVIVFVSLKSSGVQVDKDSCEEGKWSVEPLHFWPAHRTKSVEWKTELINFLKGVDVKRVQICIPSCYCQIKVEKRKRKKEEADQKVEAKSEGKMEERTQENQLLNSEKDAQKKMEESRRDLEENCTKVKCNSCITKIFGEIHKLT